LPDDAFQFRIVHWLCGRNVGVDGAFDVLLVHGKPLSELD
jgi:hypothetical protein